MQKFAEKLPIFERTCECVREKSAEGSFVALCRWPRKQECSMSLSGMRQALCGSRTTPASPLVSHPTRHLTLAAWVIELPACHSC